AWSVPADGLRRRPLPLLQQPLRPALADLRAVVRPPLAVLEKCLGLVLGARGQPCGDVGGNGLEGPSVRRPGPGQPGEVRLALRLTGEIDEALGALRVLRAFQDAQVLRL